MFEPAACADASTSEAADANMRDTCAKGPECPANHCHCCSCQQPISRQQLQQPIEAMPPEGRGSASRHWPASDPLSRLL